MIDLPQDIKDIILIAAGSVSLLALLWAFILNLRLRSYLKRWSRLLANSKAENLEQLLAAQMEKHKGFENRVFELKNLVEVQERKMKTAIRGLGLVKFDAYDDVSGLQSFALAIQNEEGEGVLITSIATRNDCRVYAKKIVSGKTDRELMEEEQEALNKAQNKSTAVSLH